jgi:hypothetical protein
MVNTHEIYGLVAEFIEPEGLLTAVRGVREAGYQEIDTFTPFPIAELGAALGLPRTRLPALVLIGGLSGASLGFLLQTYAHVFDYPWNVGGRPYWSWQAFIPITFELGILFAALSAVFGMLALNRLPQPYHPVFNTPGFRRASVDRFFLVVEAADPRYNREQTSALLRKLGAFKVDEVPCWPSPRSTLPTDKPVRQERNLSALEEPSPVANREGVSKADE